MCGTSSKPALFVISTNPLIRHLLATSTHFPYPIDPGHIYPWILSLDFPPLKETPPSLPSTDSAKWHTPLKKLPSAKETAALLLLHIVRLQGIPVDIVSDPGPQFTSIFWREFCSLLGASVSLSSGFHRQSNGQTERTRKWRLPCASSPCSWAQHLVWVEYAHNTLTSSASGLSPFQCAYGFQPPLFPALEKEASCPLCSSIHSTLSTRLDPSPQLTHTCCQSLHHLCQPPPFPSP